MITLEKIIKIIQKLIELFTKGQKLYNDNEKELNEIYNETKHMFGGYNIIHRNTIQLFYDLNQGDEEWSRYACTFFGPAINLKYNCGIKITEKDIKIIAERQEAKGLFNPKGGGKIEDGVYAVYDYVKENAKERGWDVPKVEVFKKYIPSQKKALLNRIRILQYSVIMGIGVNKTFYKDTADGVIDETNYYKFKGKVNHCTNLAGFDRKENDGVDRKEFIMDSYAFGKREWIYECNVEKILNSISMNTFYIFSK